MHGIMVPHSVCGDSRPRLSGGAKLRSLCSLHYAPSFNLDTYDRQRWSRGELALAGQPRAAVPTFFLGGGGFDLHRRTLLFDQLPDLLHEIRRRHVFRFFFPTRTHVYLARLCLFVSDYEEERNLLHGVLADLGVHLFVAGVDLDAHSDGLELIRDFVGVLRVAFADGDHRHLHRREPYRERARVVLNEHAEETLDRSVESAVHHDRLLAGAVFGNVFEAEALRQVEVELHRRQLPQAADRVYQLDVDLRPVEGGFAGDGFVFDVARLQHLLQRLRRVVPLFFAANKILAIVGVPGGELGLKLVEAKILQHIESELEAAGD